jgi:hypothetical protein
VFNSTGEARDSHTETFRKYAPDRKMIAIPGRERFLRGYLGSVWTSRYARSLMGPLDAYAYGRGAGYFDPALFAPTKLGGIGLGVLLIAALVLLAFVRYQDVSVAPGRVAASLEWVFPGTSPAWRWAGAPVLVAWATLALATILQLTIASPYLLISAWLPGVLRAFGYPNNHLDLNPPMTLLVTGLAVLWLANVVAIKAASRSRQAGS